MGDGRLCVVFLCGWGCMILKMIPQISGYSIEPLTQQAEGAV